MPPFDPLGFFQLAQTLIADTPNEASQRTCIGRAYYACHLVARDRLYGLDGRGLTKTERRRLSGKTGRGTGPHISVIAAIAQNQQLNQGKAIRLSGQLGQLKDMREAADYFRDPSSQFAADVFTKHNVRDWNDLAKSAMVLASNLLPDLERLK